MALTIPADVRDRRTVRGLATHRIRRPRPATPECLPQGPGSTQWTIGPITVRVVAANPEVTHLAAAIVEHDLKTTVLSAAGKARAADQCAHRVAHLLGCGALVAIGGNVAVAGEDPDGGWTVLVQDGPGQPNCRMQLRGVRGLATWSTARRAREREGTLWRTVSVAADDCVTANAEAAAAIVRGSDAVRHLVASGLAARLVRRDGIVVVVNDWPLR